MSLKDARVLLTGASGFIGSRVALALDAAGAATTVLARASSRGGRQPRVIADMGDPASLAAAVASADPEYVLHLAKDREAGGFEAQARATTGLAAALSAGAPNLKRWVRTAHAGGARGADELLAKTLASRRGISVVTLELFLVYGPGQRRSDFPLDLLDAALSGGRWEAPEQEKDLVFVDDVARAYLLAAECPKADGAWISIGGGRLVTGYEAVQAVAKAAGVRCPDEVRTVGGRRPPSHPAPLVRARELLGWEPRVSLDEGLGKLVQWRREHLRD
ncbi:MAG: NAD(P)-dependent oxidoreductase [Elusimicrobiota bacterium]